MALPKIFIDGQEGTTGLQIRDRLSVRKDLELLEIPAEKRKDPDARKSFLNAADLCILCLPDDAARESVSLITNGRTRIIDASTAHRVAPDFAYGFPELSDAHRKAIVSGRYVSNPGCHATGFVAAVYPLVKLGLISADSVLCCHSVTGYSGGGKKLIASFEANQGNPGFTARPYALSLQHKHIPEMREQAGLKNDPLFTPIVCNYYKGMIVSTLLPQALFLKKVAPRDVHDALSTWFSGKTFVTVMPCDNATGLDDGGLLSPTALNDTNQLQLFVFGRSEQMVVAARLDNLGKGASGAAVQNMNLMLGFDEREGL